ncbi:hypothetical protein [Spiroplasma phoeniceum]|uniref:Uncharacterized protein n=1 Tax=Spiroplasma phoeniceum P40 TaxID=1276259 RepID=A0A345DQ19_9MOLU|nr:hypothetical protein [Spiroplasma phoeniceum]AXF96307.1 hypothetical protein SDAV_001340 [Spiroplasma phoeniceum P40]
MKKLLSLLCVLTISENTMQTVIAASSYEKNDIENCKRKKRESNDKFLPKLIKNNKFILYHTHFKDYKKKKKK